MQIVVCCNEEQKSELTATGFKEQARVVWVFEKVDLLHYKSADAVVDLLYENNNVNNALLRQLSGIKIINSVADTLHETDASFVRINGWGTLLKAPTLEASCRHGDLKKLAEDVFTVFHKMVKWLPDEPGFVVPRVVSLIVNEAYFALAEGVSTRDEIDTAMKLGTAYPFGPFEWSKKLGVNNIATLLKKLSNQQPRYTPAPLLLREAGIT
jgi:3-hydroxybutyryl-CoA dehydrogenase